MKLPRYLIAVAAVAFIVSCGDGSSNGKTDNEPALNDTDITADNDSSVTDGEKDTDTDTQIDTDPEKDSDPQVDTDPEKDTDPQIDTDPETDSEVDDSDPVEQPDFEPLPTLTGFANADFEEWEPEQGTNKIVHLGTNEPEKIDIAKGWKTGDYTSALKADGYKSGASIFLGYVSTSTYTEEILKSPSMDCSEDIPEAISLMMRGDGKIFFKLEVGTASFYYQKDEVSDVFEYTLTPPSGDFNQFDTYIGETPIWKRFLIRLGDEIKDVWKAGNKAKLSITAGKNRTTEFHIDDIELVGEGPECYTNADCEDEAKPFCDINENSETFRTCLPLPECTGKTIKQIRNHDGVKDGDLVTVCKAHVTSHMFKDKKNLFVADPDGGDNSGIRLLNLAMFHEVSIGDYIRISGTYSEMGTRSWIKDVTYEKLPFANKTPEPVIVTPASVQNEKYEGRLVRIENSKLTEISEVIPGTKTWEKEPNMNDYMLMDTTLKVTPYFFMWSRDDLIVDMTFESITGIIDNQREGVYVLYPRDADDLKIQE